MYCSFWRCSTIRQLRPRDPGRRLWGLICPRILSARCLKVRLSGWRICTNGPLYERRCGTTRTRFAILTIARGEFMKVHGMGEWISTAQWQECERMARPGIVFEISNAEGLSLFTPCVAPLPPMPLDWKSAPVPSQRGHRSARRRSLRPSGKAAIRSALTSIDLALPR